MRKLIFFTLVIFFGCGTPKQEGKTDAEILYKEAVYLTEKGRYIMATEKVNQLKTRYPYSFYATHAELLQADILFLQENYIEAAAAYILFRDFHPRHEKMPYVIWRIAQSYFNQLPTTFDRDLSPGYLAIKYFKEVQQKFPGSDRAKQAGEELEKVRDMFKSKEMYIADYYFRTGGYTSAIFRYKKILDQYKDANTVDEAVYRIIESTRIKEDHKSCLNYIDQYYNLVTNRTKKTLNILKEVCSEKAG